MKIMLLECYFVCGSPRRELSISLPILLHLRMKLVMIRLSKGKKYILRSHGLKYLRRVKIFQ